tara:strand:+ start:683 stop:898 length:216 start_codon:yes stop_codon:yes gene_type:complete
MRWNLRKYFFAVVRQQKLLQRVTVAISRSADSDTDYLLLLMVAVGAGGSGGGEAIFNHRVMGSKMSAFQFN